MTAVIPTYQKYSRNYSENYRTSLITILGKLIDFIKRKKKIG